MSYLMIRNPGVADYRGLTLLGVSTSRHSNKPGTIGLFGSGSKNSIASLLRNNITPVIYTGNLKMEFSVSAETVGGKVFNQVVVKYSGSDIDGKTKNNTEKLGFVTEFGIKDWNKLAMAYREFVSNAIDGSIETTGNFNDVEFEIVEKPRAKSGHTSIFLPYTPEIASCHNSLNIMFMHFTRQSYLKNFLVPKTGVLDDKVHIYKKGVLVCLMNGKSVYDYNFSDDLELDESRNAQHYEIRYHLAGRLKDFSVDELSNVMKHVKADKTYFESDLNYGYAKLNDYWSEGAKADYRKKYRDAWDKAFTDKAVLCPTPELSGFIYAKGLSPVNMMSSSWNEILISYGIPSASDILNGIEQNHGQEVEVTEVVKNTFDFAWSIFVKYEMTNTKNPPVLKCYRPLQNGNMQEFGLCCEKDGCIYINVDIGGADLLKTCIHELIHWVTSSEDCTRDYQDACLRLTTLMCLKEMEIASNV